MSQLSRLRELAVEELPVASEATVWSKPCRATVPTDSPAPMTSAVPGWQGVFRADVERATAVDKHRVDCRHFDLPA